MNSGVSRRLVVTAVLATGLGLVAAGCSAGQVTQTGDQVAAIDGASGDVGSIAVRNAMLAFPIDKKHYESGSDAPLTVVIVNNGTSPDKLLTITSDQTSGPAEVEGDTELPPKFTLRAEHDASEHPTSSGPKVTPTPSSSSHGADHSSVAPTSTTTPSVSVTITPSSNPSGSSSVAPSSSAASSSAPSSSAKPTLPLGKITITLKGLTQDVWSGQTVKVTFLFQNAGPLTLDVPIGPSLEPRTEESHGASH